MQLEGTIGNFSKGAEADFIVIDPQATPLLQRRTSRSGSLEELLFALALLGDDRASPPPMPPAARYTSVKRLN
jgi:guanine deaminase